MDKSLKKSLKKIKRILKKILKQGKNKNAAQKVADGKDATYFYSTGPECHLSYDFGEKLKVQMT